MSIADQLNTMMGNAPDFLPGREMARTGLTLAKVTNIKDEQNLNRVKCLPIGGLDQVDAQVYHMGTAVRDGQVITSGGRVLMVVSSGKDLADAREKVYAEVRKISCDNLFYRNDIAHLAFEKI